MIAKNRKVVLLFTVWMFILLAIVTINRSIRPDTIFIFSFIAFLMIVGLSGPFTSKPKWRSRVGVVISFGALILFVIVILKIYNIVITPLAPLGV